MRRLVFVRLASSLLALLVHGAASRPAGRNPPTPPWRSCCKGARATLPGACSQPNADRLIKHPLRQAHPRRRARLLSAVRHARRRDARRATRSTSRWPSAACWASRSSSSASTPPPASPLLAEDRIDLAIATMGHNTQRDGQARFIRPHYYRSETTVVGPRDAAGAGTGRTCRAAPSASPSATARTPSWSRRARASCCSTRRACCPTG